MNNKSPQLSVIFDRRHIATPTRKGSIEVRILYNYQQKYISTGIMLYPHQWKNGKIVNCPDMLQISQTLDKLIGDIRQVLLDMIKENNVDIMAIPRLLSRKETKNINFMGFCIQKIENKKYGKALGTHRRYECFIKLFKEWGRMIRFEDVNDTNIIAFDRYLTNKKMSSNSRWGNYHKFLNSLIKDAINEGFITRNPYKWLSIEREHSNGIKKHLTPEEFRKLKITPMPTAKLEKVKDLFIFQTYTCLSYTDLKDFNAIQVQEVNGTKTYIGSRNKTGKPFTIPILSPAWDILMKYDGKLPVMNNVKYNLYLKIVAQTTGIDKPLSSHWARHTGATLLLNEGIDIKIVSKICGHSSTKITEQVYANLLDETVVDAVKNVKLDLK